MSEAKEFPKMPKEMEEVLRHYANDVKCATHSDYVKAMGDLFHELALFLEDGSLPFGKADKWCTITLEEERLFGLRSYESRINNKKEE
jgi:hypothetical protein